MTSRRPAPSAAAPPAVSPAPRQRRRRRLFSARNRSLMSLGAVGFLAVGLGAQGTFAFWTDQAKVETGTFSSGTLDVTLNGALAGAANNGGSISLPSLSLSTMVPGESQAQSFPIANAGTVGLTYTINGTGTGALAPGMLFEVHVGTSSNSGTAAAGTRTGSCSGATLAPFQVLGGTASVMTATPRALAVGASENVCIIAKLNPDADNSMQGKSMSGTIIFNAKQVNAP